MKKWIKILLVALAIVCIIFVIFPDKETKENQIFQFVLENQENLDAIAQKYLSGERPAIDSQFVRWVNVYDGQPPIVQFDCMGAGFGPETRYYGFYYSEENLPAALDNVQKKLTAVEDGWSWSESGQDNGGFTKRITDRWFYFEAWF